MKSNKYMSVLDSLNSGQLVGSVIHLNKGELKDFVLHSIKRIYARDDLIHLDVRTYNFCEDEEIQDVYGDATFAMQDAVVEVQEFEDIEFKEILD